MDGKTCRDCGVHKTLESFYKCKQGKLGRHTRCIPCYREANKKSYLNHREVRRASAKEYRIKNRDLVLQQKRDSHKRNYKNNKAKQAAYNALWVARNKEYVRQRERDRYRRNPKYRELSVIKAAYRRAAIAPWANKQAINEIYKLARSMSTKTGIKHVVDHIYPVKGKLVCGLHVETNLRVVTESENAKKKNKMPEELGVV